MPPLPLRWLELLHWATQCNSKAAWYPRGKRRLLAAAMGYNNAVAAQWLLSDSGQQWYNQLLASYGKSTVPQSDYPEYAREYT